MSEFVFIQVFGAVGMVVIILSIIAVGWWDNAKILDWKVAAERFLEDFPEHVACSGDVASDGKAALLLVTYQGRDQMGVVATMGDLLCTRLLNHRDVVLKSHKVGLLLSVNDLTFPELKIPLPPATADRWIRQFENTAE